MAEALGIPASPPSTMSAARPFVIAVCAGPADVAAAAALVRAYTDALGLDLGFQGLAGELAALPGAYAGARRGRLLLAREAPASTPDGDGSERDGDEANKGAPLGVVALRELALANAGEESPRAGGACEIKRLYVAPSARGRGVGRALSLAVLREARALGYGEARLDTLERLTAPRRLWAELGFEACAPYAPSPLEDTIWLRRALD